MSEDGMMTGTAGGGRRHGAAIQTAMARAVAETEAESDRIWADPSLDEATRREKIAAINAPEAVRARMHAARAQVKDEANRARARFDAERIIREDAERQIIREDLRAQVGDDAHFERLTAPARKPK